MIKTLPNYLKEILDQVNRSINFKKLNALNSRVFKKFCKENNTDFKNLLFHKEVRWLSKGKSLNIVFKLRNKMKDFFVIKKEIIF